MTSPGRRPTCCSTTWRSAPAADPTDPRELRYATEDELQVLPTFAVVAPTVHATEPPARRVPRHLDRPAPRCCTARSASTCTGRCRPTARRGRRARVTDVWDKGSAAVIVTETAVTDLDGAPLWTNTSSIFARGEGGFGGERGPSGPPPPPDRAPDTVIVTPTLPQQALWYRLLGDRNPLHSQPEFAEAGRFPAADPARAVHLRHGLPRPRRRAARRRRHPGGCARACASPASCSPARRCAPRCGATDGRLRAHHDGRRARRRARAVGRVAWRSIR